MKMPHSVRWWLHLPSRVALILGIGALPTTGGPAAAQATAPGPAAAPAARGDIGIRSEGGKVYVSEGGREFREVPLGDNPQARHLRQLLESNGAAAGPAGLRLSPMRLAGGGGAGFHWTPFRKSDDPPEKKAADPSAGKAGTQKPPSSTPQKAPGDNAKG